MRDSVREIDSDGARLSRSIRPIPIIAQNLEASDRLSEKQRNGSKISVASCLAITTELVLLRSARVVNHVPEVVFTLLLIRVLFNEILLVWKLQDDSEEAEQRKHYVRVKGFGKVLYFREMGLQEWWLLVFALEVLGEFRDVVDFDVVLDWLIDTTTCTTPTLFPLVSCHL